MVHGDDLTVLGCDQQIDWCRMAREDEYEIKLRSKFGPDLEDDKQIEILNRCLHWRNDGLAYEADPRHAKIPIKEMRPIDFKEVATPV